MDSLAFYLDAPLQSWGASSKFQHRQTNSFPTKSAVVGLLEELTPPHLLLDGTR